MSTPQTIVAVGSAGSATGFCAVRALKAAAPDLAVSVIACDINPRHLVAAAVHAPFLRLPPASDPGFAATASAALAERGVGCFFPIHDLEVSESARAVSVFAAAGITLCAPAHAAVEAARDKLSLCDRLTAAGIATPTTTRPRDTGWHPGGLIVKPRRGVGSHGFRAFDDADGWRAFLAAAGTADLIAQPRLETPELTIDVFWDPDRGTLHSACRERLEVKAGVTTKARVFFDPDLDRLGRDIARALGLAGSFCYQVRRDPATGGWSVIDINPRIGGATATSVALGLNFPAAHAAYHLGLPADPFFDYVKREAYVMRSYQENVMPA